MELQKVLTTKSHGKTPPQWLVDWLTEQIGLGNIRLVYTELPKPNYSFVAEGDTRRELNDKLEEFYEFENYRNDNWGKEGKDWKLSNYLSTYKKNV